ncbi:MAG: helix-turn-helix domain-containing protein [Elusimicrobia bacterium]|nr:helix-turn-helix domain-containing protein [Elusimicrobiota bacterium]
MSKRCDLLTTEETCQLLQISRQTLYSWIELDKIKPWRKLGGRGAWFFFRNEALKAKNKKYLRVKNGTKK